MSSNTMSTDNGKGTDMLAEIFGVDAIIVVVVVAVVLFGGTQIPKLARSLGTARSEFKKGLSDVAESAGSAGSAAHSEDLA